MIKSRTKTEITEREAAFRHLITEPLEAVLGQTLLGVSYWLLDYDAEGFSEQQPNETGVLVVSLHFEDAVLEISPGWEKSLRSEGSYHHIQINRAGQPDSLETAARINLCEIGPVTAAPWQETVGQRLTRVEVAGFPGSPQAVLLFFLSVEASILTGYAGDDLLIGDGDELLVFSDREWQGHTKTHREEWVSLWQASATKQVEFQMMESYCI